MEVDDDVIIPDGLQSEDPEALNNSDTPPYYIRSYYRIPKYKNKYNTQFKLRIAKSTIDGAGLGLFAFMNWQERAAAAEKGIEKPLIFKGRPSGHKISTYIDEYRGELITAANEKEMNEKLDEIGDSPYRAWVSGRLVIDSNKSTDCYARYANDIRDPKRYNAYLISSSKTKSSAIIAIKDIYADDEIFINYRKGYWKNRNSPKTVEPKNKPGKKGSKKSNVIESEVVNV
jgi:hypothetical protein